MDDNQLKLPNGKIITFNEEQFNGVEKIKVWLKEHGKIFFTLSGPAGSGKSTILKKVIDNYRGGVIVSAPTHQACKVIRRTTKKNSQTLQALLGLRPDVMLDNFNPNQPQFNPIAMPKITDYNLVVIDEASMINVELYELIVKLVGKSRTKVLFVGDVAQIPPIGEKISAVFVESNIGKIHYLTKVERQSETNPSLLICDTLRNNLETTDGNIRERSEFNNDGDGILFTINKKEFRKRVIGLFKSVEYKKDVDYCKGIAWKNDTVILSNKIVRDELFGKDVDIIEIDDTITGYRSISDEKLRHNIIENSATYKVTEKHDLEENAYGINGHRIQLREDSDSGYKYDNVFVINTNDHNNLHLYAEMHDFFRDMGKSNKKNWKKYYEFRRNNLLMVDIEKYRNGLYRTNSNIIKRDIDYGYFITCHKAQGSTYQHAVVNKSDIYQNWVMKERNQILYVALSRAAKTTTVLTNKITL